MIKHPEKYMNYFDHDNFIFLVKVQQRNFAPCKNQAADCILCTSKPSKEGH